ncbi:MAG: hypothetical protein KDJ45_11560 [Hyphomicrobiaceae bacterium]|nr:hypothetical protein [Hyphomicrobiaceae bacterium]
MRPKHKTIIQRGIRSGFGRGAGLLGLCHGSRRDLPHRLSERIFGAIGTVLTRCVYELLALCTLILLSCAIHHGTLNVESNVYDLLANRELASYSVFCRTEQVMSDELTQAEADALLALAKIYTLGVTVEWPLPGAKKSVNLVSRDKREAFLLDVSRASIKLERLVIQTRARTTVVLARLDIEGAGHRNPDGEELPCPHIHLYREGYHDKWAFPVPAEHFTDLTDRQKTLSDFMRYCQIVAPPEFVGGLI